MVNWCCCIWGFRKQGYPQIIHFNRVFQYKPSILGYPYFWKHPYICFFYWEVPQDFQVIQLLQVRQRNSSHLRLVVSSKCSHGEDGMERNKLRIGERGADRYPWGVCMWQVGCGVTVTRLRLNLLIDSLGILAWGRKPMVCKVGSMFKLSEVLWVKKLCFLYILFKLEIISFTGY